MVETRMRFFASLGVFVALAVSFGQPLKSQEALPALMDVPAPEFDLPPVMGRERGLSSSDLKGDVRLVNFFASWCPPCWREHPLLVQLTEDGVVAVFGINYRDRPEAARRYLDRLGDPYARSGADIDGKVGQAWGVAAMPTTYIVDRRGHIVYKHIGPITQSDLDKTILPVIESLRE